MIIKEEIKIFENSNLRLLNLDDKRFIIQIEGPYPLFLTGNLDHKTSIKDNAKIFNEIKILNESCKILVVNDIEGKSYICFGEKGYEGVTREYDYIGTIDKNGEIVVNYIVEGHTMWGYVNKKNYKKNNFYLKKDKPYFLEAKIGNYFVIGKEDSPNDKNKVWISGGYTKNRNKVWWDFKYQNVDYYSQIEGSPSTFFVGVRETRTGNKILDLYKSNVDKENFEFPPPDEAPDSYREIVYDKNNKFFLVTRLNGLLSILFYDNDKGFIYWPDTDRRIFLKYEVKDKFLFAKKEDGFWSIIHRDKGDLSYLWSNVSIRDNKIFYLYKNSEYQIKFSEIENAYKLTVEELTQECLSISKELGNNMEGKESKRHTSFDNDMIIIDYIAFTTRLKFYGDNELKVTIPKKIIGAKQGTSICEGNKVALVNTGKNKIYYGNIKNTRISSDYYVFAIEYVGDIEDWNLQVENNKGYYPIYLKCNIADWKEQIKRHLQYDIRLFQTSNKDKEEIITINEKDYNKVEITEMGNDINKEIEKIQNVYSELMSYNFSENKIFQVLEILFENTFLLDSWKLLIDEYAKTLKTEPDYNSILDEIKVKITDEEADEFMHRYRMGLKYKTMILRKP